MKDVRMTSSSAWSPIVDGVGTKAQVPAPAAALSASTRVLTAASRGSPNFAAFSISSSDTTSAPRPLIALTILACGRAGLPASAAPRGPLGPQSLTVMWLPARSSYQVHEPPAATQSAPVVG